MSPRSRFKGPLPELEEARRGHDRHPVDRAGPGHHLHLELFRAQVFPAIARAGGDRPLERAGLVASQLLGLALTRYLLKLPPLVAMERETIVREIGATVQRYAAGAM